ncbi:hypothetical protein MRX96_008172 [Rhipicephalus microplus]
MAEADVPNEAVLVERVFLRFVTAETPHESIRKKVMELLVHVNKRLKSRPQVQLPVEALLTHYAASAGGQQQSSFFVNFALVYLRMGFPRLPSCQQVELLPRLMECLTLNKQHQDEILNLALGAIPHVVAAHQAVGGKGPALPVPLGQSEAWALLRDRLLDLLLLPYGSPVDGGEECAPGLSMTAVSCLQGCSPEELEQRKMAVVQLLADGGLYPEHSVVLHLLVAAADTRHSVAGAAELKMKTLATALDWNDETFVNGLYNLYLGSCVPVASSTVSEQSRTPADTRLRLKILPCLTKSSRAASMLPLALMVTFDTLNSPGNAKLKGMALEFIQAVCNNNPEDKLSMVGGQLMATLLQLALPSQDMDMRLRVLACSALGHLSRKLPRLVANDLSLVQTLFNGLAKEESSEGRLALQEALVAVGPAYAAWADNDTRQMLLALVSTHGSASSANCRHAALRYAATVYAADYAPARYLLLMAAGDSQEEIRREALKALYPAAEASTQFPPFTDMLQLVLSKAGATASAGLPHVSSLPWSQLQYSQVLRYLRRCLHASAGVTGAPDERSLRDSTGAPRVCRYLHSLAAQGDKKPGAMKAPLVSLVELVASAAPDQSFSLLEAGTGVLKGLLLSGREAVRECAAQLVGLLMASHPPDTFRGDLQALCTDIRRKTEGGSLEGRQSSLLVLAHALCRRHQAGLGLEGVAEAITLLADTFLQAQQSCSWPLVLPSSTQGALVYALTSLLHNAKAPSKCREEAARTLGLLCLGQPDFPHVHQVLTGLLKCGLVESADVEVHFTVGESLCCAVLGKTSPLCRDPWTTEEAEYKPPVGATANLCEMEWLMSQLLDNYLCHPRPGARQAACVWTLSLLKRCSQQSPVLLQLEHAQAALLNLLADRSGELMPLLTGFVSFMCTESSEILDHSLFSLPA